MHSISIVETKLRKMRQRSPMHIETPTPERVLQAGENVVYGSAVRSVDLEINGQHRAEQIRIPRVRITEDPFERLASRGQLAPDDAEMNKILADVGERYRRLHHKAGLQSLKAMDPSSGFTTNRSGSGLLGTEAKCDFFQAYSAAADAVTYFCRRALDAILLRGEKPEQVGRTLGVYCDKKICMALALTYLRTALHELAKHFDRVDQNGAGLDDFDHLFA